MSVTDRTRTARVLLCATETGGIRNLSPVYCELRSRGTDVAVLTSRRLLGLWELGSGASGRVWLDDELDSPALERIVDDIRPSAIISGAALGPEKWINPIGRARGILVIAVMDEWYGYRERFADASGALSCLPDVIALPDDRARQEALSEGLPASICIVTGSPGLAALSAWAAAASRVAPPRPELLSGVMVPVVTFVSETLREDYGSPELGRGELGTYIGYTQDSVLAELKAVLRELEPSFLVEKLHLSSQLDETQRELDQSFQTVRTRSTPLWPLLWHSDAVIGMRSMALLEAHLLGCAAASFQPGLRTRDRCTASRLNLIPRFSRADHLKPWLTDVLTARRTDPARRARSLPSYPFASADAAKHVISIAEAVKVVDGNSEGSVNAVRQRRLRVR